MGMMRLSEINKMVSERQGIVNMPEKKMMMKKKEMKTKKMMMKKMGMK